MTVNVFAFEARSIISNRTAVMLNPRRPLPSGGELTVLENVTFALAPGKS
jgi:hypothetical protein